MKALLLLVIIYNLQNVCHLAESDDETSFLMKYPKKANPIYKHHQKLINSGRVHKKLQEGQVVQSSRKTGLMLSEPFYSLFPSKVGMSQMLRAPDSPLFPLGFDFEHKHRIKKTLNNRNKRSTFNDTNVSLVARADDLSKVTVVPPTESENKAEETVKPTENKEVENKAKETVKPKVHVALSENLPKETENPEVSKQKENIPTEKVKEKKPKRTGKPTTSKHTENNPKETVKPKASILRQKRPKASVTAADSKLREKRPRAAVKLNDNKLRHNTKLAVKPKDNKQGLSKLRENKPKGNRSALKTKRDPVKHKKALRENKQTGNKTALKTKTNTVRLKSGTRNRTKNSKARSRRDTMPNRGLRKKVKIDKSGNVRLRNRLYNKTTERDGKERPARAGRKQVRSILRLEGNQSGKGQKASRRLIAARDVSPEDYPYMASIQKDSEHWCSGAVLNRRLIISTANCFWKSQKVSRLKVRIGARNVDSGGQLAKIQEVMKHPKWDIRKPPDNDIALALLDRNIKFSHSVHAVDLPNRAMLPPFDDAWVTSFGAERRDGVYVQHATMTLQMYHARLVDPQKCNNITQRFGVPVSNNFICLSQSGRRSPCTRDTGAPAVSDGILWGLASWGIRRLCGTERFPAMFSYTASESNLDFIINATSYLMVDERENPMLDRLPRIPGKPHVEAQEEADHS